MNKKRPHNTCFASGGVTCNPESLRNGALNFNLNAVELDSFRFQKLTNSKPENVIGHCKKRHIMKIVSFILTILIQFLSLVTLKLLDNFYHIILIFMSCLVSGLFIRINSPTQSKTKKIGWGLLFGSLTSLTLTIVFVIWLSFNFPK